MFCCYRLYRLSCRLKGKMADDLDDEWWVGADSGTDNSEGVEPPQPSIVISESDNEDGSVSKVKNKRETASKKKTKLSKKRKSHSQDAPFGKFKGPSVISADTEEKLEDQIRGEKRSSADTELVEGEVLQKKKRKRKNKTQALAECKNPIKPMEEFMGVLKAKQAKMTVIERDEVDLSAVSFIQEPLDDVKGDLSAALLSGSLARCGALLSREAKPRGQPFILVVTASAIRAMDLKRNLQKVSPECKVAKLFAKHIKIGAQVKNMTETSTQVAVGTPRRIYELIELDALKLSKLKYILLDWTWRDTKLRRMVDVGEVKQDLLLLLFKHLLTKAIKYNTQVILL